MTSIRLTLLVFALLVVTVSPLGIEPPAFASGTRTGTAPPSNGSWVAHVQRAVTEKEYEASENREGLQAPNRAQNWRTYFGPTGIRVVDRTAEGSPELLTLRVSGWGRAGSIAALEPGQVTSTGSRVEIRRPALVEWFENSAAGLEQGFTLMAPPAGEGPLVLQLALGGAQASARRERLALTAPGGRRLEYGGLRAWDATGRPLPARLELKPAGVVRIAIEDAGAHYPVTVDPLLTSGATLQSDQANAYLGIDVADAGDVNGDGYADVIVGAHFYDGGQTDEGAAFVFLGSAAGVASGSPVTAAATLESDQASAYLGYSVAGAGDVNGDGYADVIVGAPNYDKGETDEGAAFVFLGSAAGVASGNPASAAATIESDQAVAVLGLSVAGAGDVNGDGYADVIVGAYMYDAGETNEGAAFVFQGGAAGIVGGNPSVAATTLQSDQAGSSLGYSVSGAGDVNGDGYADVIVGATNYDAGQTDEGAAFVFLGNAAGVGSGSPATAAAIVQSDQAAASLGYSVSGAGDVNGDGYADVLVGANSYDAGVADEGAAFVFLGSAVGVVSGNPSTAAATLQSDQASAYFGWSVAGVGDVNGDGYADVIVGDPYYDAGQADEGAAFLFLGSAAGVVSGNPNTAAATLQSDQASARLGFSVAAAGDVNGDGYADAVAGATYYDAGEINEGAAFVFLGSAAGVLSGSPATAAATLQSDQASAYLGYSVAGAGDVNGDGYADVIVGAPYYDAGQLDEGAAFVFLGGPAGVLSGSPATAAATLQSDQASAYLGYSVAGVGDVNGDGYADVIVGAPYYDAGTANEGAAFVFLGSGAGVANGNPVTAAATMQGDQVIAYLGNSVAGAGDVNGDGYADVIVGARYFDGGSSDEGAAFVFLGSASGVASGNPATADARLESNQASAFFGWSVAGAGDVNGDGFADVIVGAYNYDAGETNEGAAFVFLGSSSGIANGNPTTAAAILQSDQASASLGWSVAGAGDVNGDSYADVIVAAHVYDAGELEEGAAFVFLGSAAGVASGNPASAATMLQSDQAAARMGSCVAGAGDVNGDGYADVIVTAPLYDAGEDGEGAAFVFLGSAAGVAGGNPATAAAVLQSNQVGAQMGSAAAGAGDVNGDGFADVILGGQDYDAGQPDEGAAFVFLGGGGATGRATLARQSRGDGSGLPVQPWGGSYADGRFWLGMRATSPAGWVKARLEAEYCPAGIAFGAPQCGHLVAPSWRDLTPTEPSVALEEQVRGLGAGTLYHWRVRTQYVPRAATSGITLPPAPPHGPWRRLSGQAVEADVRTGAPGVAVGPSVPSTSFAIEGLRPNPAAGRFEVTFVVPVPRPARLELLDIAGRRVLSRELRAVAAGRQTVTLGEARALPAGIYLVRLSQAGRATSARIALLQ